MPIAGLRRFTAPDVCQRVEAIAVGQVVPLRADDHQTPFDSGRHSEDPTNRVEVPVVTLVLTLAAVSVLSQLIWLAYCVYLIERHPADPVRQAEVRHHF